MMLDDRARALGTDIFFKDAQRSGDWCWSRLQGGAPEPYSLVFACSEATATCSCALRERPCVHVRAFVHWIRSIGFEQIAETETLPEWLPLAAAGRQQQFAQHNSDNRLMTAKRRQERLDRASRGLEELKLWLDDLGRRGLATVIAEEPDIFGHMAVRMSDASLVGLSRRLRLLSSLERDPVRWPEQVMGELTLAWMAIRTYERRHGMPELLLDDLEQYLGISVRKEEVYSRGAHLNDVWVVLGKQEAQVERGLDVRRTWLFGRTTHRFVLLVDYAYGQAFPAGFAAGSAWSGTMAFYPSAHPLRALQAGDSAPVVGEEPQIPSGWSVAAFRHAYAASLGKQPWLLVFPGILEGVLPVQTTAGDWFLVDKNGDTVSMPGQDPWYWVLLSMGARERIRVFGEWNGRQFYPITAQAEGFYATRKEGVSVH